MEHGQAWSLGHHSWSSWGYRKWYQEQLAAYEEAEQLHKDAKEARDNQRRLGREGRR